MGRKFSILVAFCVVLFGAILAGYWDMLDSQKLREVRDRASATLGGSAGAGATATHDATGAPATSSGNGVTAAPGASAEAGNRTVSAGPAAGPGATPSASPTAPHTAPSFDVLRIEPDGSAVLAGRATPNARIRLMDGATAIASAEASPEGDFAVVLDERLPPGDHQIRIEADKGDGVKAISEQTAIVSVPKRGEGGELLAMVETPNQPSRIINMPDPTASVTPGEAAMGSDPATGPSGTPPAAASGGTSPANAGSQATMAARDPAPAGGAPANASRPGATPSPFAVEAVEIENGTIYVAGRAPGTAPVRVYVDNNFVGEDKARANERFLVTAKLPLTLGSHEIRADMIGSDGAVASRVEVPFAKPEGEAMSAIASNDVPTGEARSRRTSASAAAAETGTVGAQGSPGRNAGEGRQAGGASVPAASASERTPAAAAASGSPSEQEATGAPGEVAAAGASDSVAAQTPDDVEASRPGTVAADGGIATIRQAPLESVHTRVLIRRGDTLWRISRETYGQGRRYTVIYLANGDQIRNPNRIYPGQLFRLPKEDSKAID